MVFKNIYKLLPVFLLVFSVIAEAQENLLVDKNGDGVVKYLGFGDSITFGVGDTEFPEGAGYVKRVGDLLGIPVENEGVPGEEIVANGIYRFPDVLRSSNADIVGLMEGTNDAIKRVDTVLMRNTYQRAINVARALGKQLIIIAMPPPDNEHVASAPFTNSYAQIVVDLASLNDVPLADFRKAWGTTCQNIDECELYNQPEGLHPVGAGYDVMAQTLAARILGIDIFAPDGASNLESALGLPAGSVLVKPAPVQP